MRLDRFLSVARLFKSRSLASEAISSGMVFVDNQPSKPSKEVRLGQVIEIDTPRYYKRFEILSIPPNNMAKKEASSLFRLIEERHKD